MELAELVIPSVEAVVLPSEKMTTMQRDFLKDDLFREIFFERAERVRLEMPSMYSRVLHRTAFMLRVEEHEIEAFNFKVNIFPSKAKVGEDFVHPRLLTYCTWDHPVGRNERLLRWEMDQIPLGNTERHDIWYNFVCNDPFYYQYPR